jgi:hypothetical protein
MLQDPELLWRYGDMELWRYGDVEIWRYGDMEIWYFTLDFTFDFSQGDVLIWLIWRYG